MKIIKTIQALFFTKALIWIIFGGLYIARLGEAGHEDYVLFITGILLFVDSLLYLLFGVFISKKKKSIYILAVLFILANMILAFADQFGWADLIVLLIDVVILGLLVRERELLSAKQKG